MPIKITLNAAAVKAIADAAAKGEPVTLTFDSSGIEKVAEKLTGIFEKIGATADHIGHAADNVAAVQQSSKLDRAGRALKSIGTWSFAALLGMIGPMLRGQRPHDN